MMSTSTMGEKFVHDLGAIYDAEHQFLTAQQQMLAQATDMRLKDMLSEHIMQTQQQIANLEHIFGVLGAQPVRAACMAGQGLVADGEKAMQAASANQPLLDCTIAASAAKVEHFEMAAYRGLVMDAQHISHPELLRLLRQILEQEEQTAAKLEQSYPLLLERAIASQKMDRMVGGTSTQAF
jgi:ferritin-like metal-binding protein YciE